MDMFSSNNSYIKKIKHDTDGKKIIIDSDIIILTLMRYSGINPILNYQWLN